MYIKPITKIKNSYQYKIKIYKKDLFIYLFIKELFY